MDIQTADNVNVPEVLNFMLSELGDLCLHHENIESENIEVSLLITDDSSIQELNKSFRAIDRPTDVLSFPSISYPHGKTAGDLGGVSKSCYIPEHRTWFIGDLAISVDRAKAQACEYGHSFLREIGFLLVHGMLHLLGYDHVEEEDRQRMRQKEQEVMAVYGLSRELTDIQITALMYAKNAFKSAFALYKKRTGVVKGACIHCGSGKYYNDSIQESASEDNGQTVEAEVLNKAVKEGEKTFDLLVVYSLCALDIPSQKRLRKLQRYADDMMLILANDKCLKNYQLSELLIPSRCDD